MKTHAAEKVKLHIEKLAQKLFEDSARQDEFIENILNPKPYPSTILWVKDRPTPQPFETLPPLKHQPSFVDRVPPTVAPTRHPLHEQGYFYSLDYSSIFEASVFSEISHGRSPRLILDTCSAPGGKSVFTWKLFQPEWLFSNEVVINRARALISNFKRCGLSGVKVLHQTTRQLAEKLEGAADIVIVDAPCTGQSLLAKGDRAPGAFNLINIRGNAKRQKRILAEASQCVAPGGYLGYMTCTFSREENEDVVEWFLKKFENFEATEVKSHCEFQSHLSEVACYRLWPGTETGAGGFTCLFRNRDEGRPHSVDLDSFIAIWKSDQRA